MKNYIINGRVAREEIASDICYGILTRDEIASLVRNKEIRSSFFGKSFNKISNKKLWDKKYLESLPNIAVAEAFNEEYLYYLADVAEYVRTNEKKKSGLRWVWILVAVLLLGILAFVIIKSRN